MKTFMKYPGGKSKEADIIKKYLPKNIDRYFEPFVGGGAIYLELEHNNSYINDFSTDLINLYKLLKEKNKELKKYLNEMDKLWILSEQENFTISKLKWFNKEEYERQLIKSLQIKHKTVTKFQKNGIELDQENIIKIQETARKTAIYTYIREIYNTTEPNDILHTAAYYFLREYCYSSMFRFSSSGDFNVPYGGMSYNNKYMTDKIEYMYSDELNKLLSNTQICNHDFEIFLTSYKLCPDDFIFLDPPYDSEFSTYDNNSFDRNEQIRLKNFLANTSAKWMLVIKKTDFIFNLYAEFNIYEYQKNYMVSFMNRNNKDVQHILITNYNIDN